MSNKVKALFQFTSLALMTQGVLLLNQIVLLPIQLRIWKTDTTALWYSILAIAAVTTISDFGLRSAGHAHLMRWVNDPEDQEAQTEFTQLWAWIRILCLLTTVVVVIADYAIHHFYLGADYPLWRTALLLGIAMESLLCVRVTYLDTQGFYTEAEAGYLVLVAGRLILSVGALVFFHAAPSVLAWIWFITGVVALVQQSFLCRRAGRLKLFERIPAHLPWRHAATVRYTMADPCSAWVRINLPVVVLSSIAPSIGVVTYVALRAIFGAARATILQLSRYASVEYLSLRQARKFEMAEKHLTMMMLLSAFFASGVAAFVVADNGRLASLLLNKMDLPIYQMVAITFGLGNAFYAFQICVSVCRRAGEVAEIAHRQYFYMICVALFAAIALATKSMLIWLVLLLAADVLLALSFMLTPPAHSILQQTSARWRT
ncbi:MAG TPA: hypothetical protein VHY09_04540, partial [Candidatus Methylacidiphilales bacterium]|nr:hypothetical protein [Candidatus Methylacidiphilales bacterium]